MNWDDFEKEIEKLVTRVTSPVDVIVPIVRGGLIPGRMLASRLHVKTMYALTVVKFDKQRKIVTEIKDELENKNMLLVEDILETGESMIVSKKYLERKGAKVQTACLYTMPQTTFVPNYSLGEINSLISFPWE
jgi:hypoxanthine phosphoribosyltransferase